MTTMGPDHLTTHHDRPVEHDPASQRGHHRQCERVAVRNLGAGVQRDRVRALLSVEVVPDQVQLHFDHGGVLVESAVQRTDLLTDVVEEFV